jgi:translation initiation factor 2B subunit (eIF-2B alpha/beta/delta family)
MENKRKRFNRIVKGIRDIKIQGARNIAKKALYAYSLIPKKRSKRKLLSLRPTEPLLRNVLDRIEKQPYNEIMQHFKDSQEKINKFTLKLIKNKDVIFTHCHSSTVNEALGE